MRSRFLFVGFPALTALFLILGCKQHLTTTAQNKPLSTSSSAPSQTTMLKSVEPAAVRASGPVRFTDVTGRAGIHFRHNNGAFGKKYLPETMGSGVCVLDYDNDGWQDILFVNSAERVL